MPGMDLTREELLFELEQRERQIEELTRELAGYRNFFHGRKIAVSAEVAPSEGSSNDLEHQKDRRTFDIIESALLANEFLCQLEQFQIDEMINAMQPMVFAPDQWIIRQGEFGSKLYVLEEGKVQVTKDSRFLRVMEAPCVFGELAILYHCERTASIKSLCNCRVWALERRIFHAVMVNTAKSKHDEMVTLMTKSKLQKMFTEEQIDLLADSVKDEEWLFRSEVDQCQVEGKLYLMVSGQITQRRNSAYGTAPELKTLSAGDILGDFYGLSLALNTLPANPALHSQIRGAAAAQRPTSRNNNVGERYFVDSVEGARLIVMLVEQICRTLDNTSLIDEPSVSQKSTADIDDVELADLKTVATLGIGGFGRVNLVKHFDTEKVYALKVMNKAHVKEMNQQEHVLNERNILISCRCDFIVRLYKTFRDAERLYMLLEYCPGGEVWTMLRNWGRFDESTARFYCASALEAFDYLHRRCIIYRDLKPENMLLDKNGIPKLADFGFAKRLKSENAKTWTFCGTAEYVAPEIILNKGQDTAVDIWSLGIFMYELISGTPPFASTDPMHTYNSILKGVNALAWPRYISDQAKSLICKFCRKDPAQRLGYGKIEEARKDVWFQGFDFVAFRNHTMRPPIRPKIRNSTDTQNFDRYPSTDNFSTGEDETGWDADF